MSFKKCSLQVKFQCARPARVKLWRGTAVAAADASSPSISAPHLKGRLTHGNVLRHSRLALIFHQPQDMAGQDGCMG